MENIITYWILPNWKRKLMALFGAIVLWLYVNQSITATKTISGIPVKIDHLPTEKTIEGLLPNHILRRRMTLTLSGNKQMLDLIEAGDIEVHLNAAEAPSHWVVQITPKDIVSLNPAIKIEGAINSVTHQEFSVDIAQLVTARIPVTIMRPRGNAPNGYEVLGIWPGQLFHTVSGPADQVEALKEEGLELHFDLDDVSAEELNSLTSNQKGYFQDEIDYRIPASWKMVRIPFKGIWESINDPATDKLHIEFLRKEFLRLEEKVPIRLYFPAKYLETINPETRRLGPSPLIEIKNGVAYLSNNLFSYDVSRLFLDIVKDHIEIVITVKPIDKEHTLRWSIEFIEPQLLEDRYVDYLETRYDITRNKQQGSFREKERRLRFREYMHNMNLYVEPRKPLKLESRIEGHQILITEGSTQ